MSQIIKLKQSASAGLQPSIAELALGELSINTHDGKIYFKKDNGTVSIQDLTDWSNLTNRPTTLAGYGITDSFSTSSPNLTGIPTAPTAPIGTSTNQIASTEFVINQANSVASAILMNGVQAAGGSTLYARADHVHPTDSTRQASLGFTPIQQGGGALQSTNKIYMGWSGAGKLRVQVDATDFADVWPISVAGNAATATSATTATNATNATKANTLAQNGTGASMTFNWVGQPGQPAWLWGGTDGANHYVYNPSNFNVNHATTADASSGIFTAGTGLIVNGGSQLNGQLNTIGNFFINNNAPTIVLQDTDHRSSMIHCNSGLFYILRGDGNNATTYTANPTTGKWPMQMDIDWGDVTFGGWGNFAQQITVGSGNSSGNGSSTVYFKTASHYLTLDSLNNFVFSNDIYGPGMGSGNNRLAYVSEVTNGDSITYANAVAYANNPGFSSLAAGAGYKRFPGNIMIQWITYTPGALANNTICLVVWPTTFATILSANLSDSIGNIGTNTTEGASLFAYDTGSCFIQSGWSGSGGRAWPVVSLEGSLAASYIIWAIGTW